jgi:hypothetical protein
MKRSSIPPIVLFALAFTGVVWANDQQIQQACVNAAICLLAVRSGLSPGAGLIFKHTTRPWPFASAVAWSAQRLSAVLFFKRVNQCERQLRFLSRYF